MPNGNTTAIISGGTVVVNTNITIKGISITNGANLIIPAGVVVTLSGN